MWQDLHDRILGLVREYYQARHEPKAFFPGQSKVPYAGRVFDEQEVVAAVDAVLDVVGRHDLFLIEDNCDALGALYRGRKTGTFGHLATQSFYPPHHLTMGEGGAVLTNSGRLKRVAESFRDWGRDCWCASGQDNTCGRRFGWQHGSLPYGYDHQYVYRH